MNNNDGFDKLWCKYDITGGEKTVTKSCKRMSESCPEGSKFCFWGRFRLLFLKLKEKLIDLIDKEEDSLRFYYLGNNWERRVEHVGAKKTYNPEGVIII